MQIFKINKLTLAVGLFGLGLTYYSNLAHRPDNWAPKAESILDQNGAPKDCLLALLKKTNITHDGTLNDIVAKTQAQWLRKPTQERWDMGGEKVSENAEFRSLLQACGCIDGIKPALKQYDYVLIMGALTGRMRLRLAYAIDLWQQGVRFKQIVFLCGMRPRQAELEDEATILGIGLHDNVLKKKEDWQFNGEMPQTEAEIMRVLYDQVALPDDLVAETETVFVNSPMKLNAEGKTVRPTTADTFVDWLKQNPKPGTCLVISNNPYVGYQDSVARSLLPSDFKVETVGPKDEVTKISVHLDNLARWLYQEQQRRA